MYMYIIHSYDNNPQYYIIMIVIVIQNIILDEKNKNSVK